MKMKRQMYAMFDKQTNTFLNPINLMNDGEATRLVQTWVNDKKDTNVSKYPHHFVMVRVGTFDDISGKFENEHKEIAECSQYKEAEESFTLENIFDRLKQYIGDK